MADAKYLCPECGSIDLDKKHEGLKGPDGGSLATAKCPNCGWSGPLRATVGVASSEQLWDFQRVAELLLRVVAKHAAGPMIQCFEFVGMLPKLKPMPEVIFDDENPTAIVNREEVAAVAKWNKHVQEARDAVMRAVFEGAITRGFEEAERQHRIFAVETNTPLHPMFEEKSASPDKEFGGGASSGE